MTISRTDEDCDNHRNVTRYGSKWSCVICGEPFTPRNNLIIPAAGAKRVPVEEDCVMIPAHNIIPQAEAIKVMAKADRPFSKVQGAGTG